MCGFCTLNAGFPFFVYGYCSVIMLIITSTPILLQSAYLLGKVLYWLAWSASERNHIMIRVGFHCKGTPKYQTKYQFSGGKLVIHQRNALHTSNSSPDSIYIMINNVQTKLTSSWYAPRPSLFAWQSWAQDCQHWRGPWLFSRHWPSSEGGGDQRPLMLNWPPFPLWGLTAASSGCPPEEVPASRVVI